MSDIAKAAANARPPEFKRKSPLKGTSKYSDYFDAFDILHLTKGATVAEACRWIADNSDLEYGNAMWLAFSRRKKALDKMGPMEKNIHIKQLQAAAE